MTAAQTNKLQFQIQQLWLAKVVVLISAIAVCVAVFLILLSLPILFMYLPNLPPQTSPVLLAVAVGFTLYAFISNIFLYRRIRALQAKLK